MSAPSISPTLLRSRSTAIRWLTATSSSSSDEATSSAKPSSAEVADQRHDFGVRADVDAARRLVEDQHARARRPASAPASPSAGCRPKVGRPACPRPAWRSPAPSIISCASRSCSSCDRRPQPAALGSASASTMFSRTVSSAEDALGSCGPRDRRRRRDAANARGEADATYCAADAHFAADRGGSRRRPAWRSRCVPSRAARPDPRLRRRATSRSNGAMTRRRPSPSATRIGSPVAVDAARAARCSACSSSRPSIIEMSLSGGSSAIGAEPTRRPLRSTEMRSAIW